MIAKNPAIFDKKSWFRGKTCKECWNEEVSDV